MSHVTVEPGEVAIVEMSNPPANTFDTDVLSALAEHIEALAAGGEARVVVLCSEGKHFCTGASLGRMATSGSDAGKGPGIYDYGMRLLEQRLPIVAAVQGGAFGGGLGLALMADFRLATPESRFAANFSRLGFHPGFGLTATLPRVIGHQRALDLFYTGRTIGGDEAFQIGLADRLAPPEQLRGAAVTFAGEIATAGPLAVQAIRRTMRGGHVAEVRTAMAGEWEEQARLLTTADFAEGVRAAGERREPAFTGI